MAPKKWTVAGAARYARDARHDTAAHMATAPIARQWRKSKMLRAFQVHATNLRDRQAASVMLLGGIGYRPPYPDGWDAAADLVTGDESRYLGAAALYVITPQMCDVVIAAAQSLTVDDLKLISEDDLPSPSGLLVLPAPMLVRSLGGDLGDDRAFCWHTPAAFMIPDHGRPDGVHAKPAVRISRYHDAYGPVRPDSFLQFAAQARQEGTPLPPLLLDSIRCLPFAAVEADSDAGQRLARAAQTVDGENRRAAERANQFEDRVIGEHISGNTIDDVDDTFTARFLYAFWRLCEQRIADIEPIETNHAAHVAAQKSGLSPEVRVVRLRQRAEHVTGESTSRDWQHRWVVRMHKVRQWYPSEQRHKVIYRGPYVKGPDGKPLLGGEVVRGLVR